MKPGEHPLNIIPIFSLGSRPILKAEDEARLEAETDEITERFGLCTVPKLFVRKEEDLLEVGIKGVDWFVLFPFCSERFSPLIYLAETGLPVIIASEEQTFCNALDTYEYIADHGNVEVALGPEEVRRRIRVLEAVRWVENARGCFFDAERWGLKGMAWNRNPLVSGKLNALAIDPDRFFNAYENADRTEAEGLARSGWTSPRS